jgi:hypothetical protein
MLAAIAMASKEVLHQGRPLRVEAGQDAQEHRGAQAVDVRGNWAGPQALAVRFFRRLWLRKFTRHGRKARQAYGAGRGVAAGNPRVAVSCRRAGAGGDDGRAFSFRRNAVEHEKRAAAHQRIDGLKLARPSRAFGGT